MEKKMLDEGLRNILSEREYKKAYLNEFPKFPARVYVVARSHFMAKHWAREANCPKESFRYVSHADALRGAEGHIVFYKNWYERNDAFRIEEIADYLLMSKRLKHFSEFLEEEDSGAVESCHDSIKRK
jgi:hypothetical protein